MARVKKSVLVPFSAAAMFELVDDVELYPRVPAMVRGRARPRDARGRQDGAHRHRLSRRQGALHDRQREPAAGIDRHHAEDGPVSPPARRMAIRGARRPRPAGSSSSSRGSSRPTCSSAPSGPCSATSRTRSSTRSCAAPNPLYAQRAMNVTVVWATARRAGHRAARRCRRARRSPTRSRNRAIIATLRARRRAACDSPCSAAGRRAEAPLADGDRVEITRPARRRSEGSATPARARDASKLGHPPQRDEPPRLPDRGRSATMRPMRTSIALGRRRCARLRDGSSAAMACIRIRVGGARAGRAANRSLGAADRGVRDAAATALAFGTQSHLVRARSDRHPLQVGRRRRRKPGSTAAASSSSCSSR